MRAIPALVKGPSGRRALLTARGGLVKRVWARQVWDTMNDTPPSPDRLTREERPTREERLAAKLRENLRRRKAQARALGPGSGPEQEHGESDLPKTGGCG